MSAPDHDAGWSCDNCHRSVADFERRVATAQAYVRSRFYPPLPVEYGRLAVEAVDAVNRGEPEVTLDVSDLPIQPRGTTEEGLVGASELVSALRLDHMIEQPCPDCLGLGWDEDAYHSEFTREPGEATCLTCDGSGMV